MTYEKMGARSIDYRPWRCPGSRLVFRGPRRPLEGEFIAFLGGTETHGRFIAHPFPQLIEERLGVACVNFGWPNAGVDVFLNEPALMEVCARARAVVVQMPGAQNMTNRYYTVHPRRNDRFIGPSGQMRTLFPEVDFTEFHFTRHMLRRLAELAPCRFASVRHELQDLWVTRMRQLLQSIGGHATLLWMAPVTSGRAGHGAGQGEMIGPEPAFLSARMMRAIRDCARTGVIVRTSAAGASTDLAEMVFSELEAAAARKVPGPSAHRAVMRELCPVLRRQLA